MMNVPKMNFMNSMSNRMLDREFAMTCLWKIGRYSVRGRLGEGGFGCVYLCDDEQLERVVAVKVPRVREGVRIDGPGGILAEARTLASLDHPNIVSIFDIQLEDDVQPYIVSQSLMARH